MCKFFSLVSDPVAQKIMYFKAAERAQADELGITPDSHTSIARYFGYNAMQEHRLNRYEYNPATKVLTVDIIGSEIDDSASIEKYCNELDFEEIAPGLTRDFEKPREAKKAYEEAKKALGFKAGDFRAASQEKVDQELERLLKDDVSPEMARAQIEALYPVCRPRLLASLYWGPIAQKVCSSPSYSCRGGQ